MSKYQFTGTATQPQCNRKFCQFNNDQYCNWKTSWHHLQNPHAFKSTCWMKTHMFCFPLSNKNKPNTITNTYIPYLFFLKLHYKNKYGSFRYVLKTCTVLVLMLMATEIGTRWQGCICVAVIPLTLILTRTVQSVHVLTIRHAVLHYMYLSSYSTECKWIEHTVPSKSYWTIFKIYKMYIAT